VQDPLSKLKLARINKILDWRSIDVSNVRVIFAVKVGTTIWSIHTWKSDRCEISQITELASVVAPRAPDLGRGGRLLRRTRSNKHSGFLAPRVPHWRAVSENVLRIAR